MKDVEPFVEAARAFLLFTHEAGQLEIRTRLQDARARLVALYAAALGLPLSWEVTIDHELAEKPVAPVTTVDFGKHDYYYEVFSPYEKSELVIGSLDDDFADIARDLETGMAYWNGGFPNNAVWEWSFHFGTHWGDHAVDALRALHRLCTPDALGAWPDLMIDT